MNRNYSRPLRGQTLVEFALILPLFLALAFFILDFGRGVYYYSVIYNAAREGARYGVSNIYLNVGLTSAVETAIRAQTREHVYGIDPLDVAIPDINIQTVNSTTQYLNVQTYFCFDPVIPIPLADSCIDLYSTATMRIEPRVLPKP